MKPIKFAGFNKIFAETQDEYINLPAYIDPTDNLGAVVSCWELTFMERIKVLFFGNIWLSLLTFNKPLQPIKMGTSFKEVY